MIRLAVEKLTSCHARKLTQRLWRYLMSNDNRKQAQSLIAFPHVKQHEKRHEKTGQNKLNFHVVF